VCWVCVGCVLGQRFSGMAVGTLDTGGMRYGPRGPILGTYNDRGF